MEHISTAGVPPRTARENPNLLETKSTSSNLNAALRRYVEMGQACA